MGHPYFTYSFADYWRNLNMTQKCNIANNFFSLNQKVFGIGSSYWPSLEYPENIHFNNTSQLWVILTSHIPFNVTVGTSSWERNTMLLICFHFESNSLGSRFILLIKPGEFWKYPLPYYLNNMHHPYFT